MTLNFFIKRCSSYKIRHLYQKYIFIEILNMSEIKYSLLE